jgi:hypothetical protein
VPLPKALCIKTILCQRFVSNYLSRRELADIGSETIAGIARFQKSTKIRAAATLRQLYADARIANVRRQESTALQLKIIRPSSIGSDCLVGQVVAEDLLRIEFR